MPFVNIDPDQRQIDELSRVLKNERQLTRIVKNALNDTARKSATAVRRQVAAELNIGVRALGSSSGKNSRGMIRPMFATDTRLESRVRILNWNIPLIKTRTTPGKGEQFPLGKESTPVSLTNAPFKQTMHNGHVGWYARDPSNNKRTMTEGTYTGKKRVPIKQVFSQSPRYVFERMGGDAMGNAGTMLHNELTRQINRYLSRKG